MSSTFRSYAAQAVGITPVDIYTVPAVTSTTVIGLSLANVTASAVTATVTITKAGVVTNIVKNIPIPTGSSVVIVGGEQKLVLEAGNKFSVTSNTASSIDVIGSILEIA